MARKPHFTLILIVAVASILSISYLFSSSSASPSYRPHAPPPSSGEDAFALDLNNIPDSILKGGSIAPKLENATAKAELGRASWKLLHTMMARFPEHPTPEDSLALKTHFHLFARLYPCGDCAAHFRKLLEKYPPQASSRNAAVGWLCFVHNEVNNRLHKPIFDCSKIGDFYDCGCGEEDGKKKEGGEGGLLGDSAGGALELEKE